MHRWPWLLLAALLVVPAVAFGQDPSDFSPDQWSVLTEGPRFFAALVAGLLIAFAFQMLLTQLSVAAGVSAVGDLHKLVHGGHGEGGAHRRSGDRHAHDARHEHGELHRGDATGLRDTWVGRTGTGPHPRGTDATSAVRRGDAARNVTEPVTPGMHTGRGFGTTAGGTEHHPDAAPVHGTEEHPLHESTLHPLRTTTLHGTRMVSGVSGEVVGDATAHEVEPSPGMHVPVVDVHGHTVGADGTSRSTGRVQQTMGTAAHRQHREGEHREGHEAHEGRTWGETVRLALSGAGVWAMLTSSIALFFASWLAEELSLTLDFVVGAVVGLAIWASFYLLLTVWEAAAVSSLAGSVTRIAMEGTRTVFGGVTSIFRKSPEARVVATAREAAGAVADELASHVDTRRIERKLDAYVSRLEPPEIDPERIKAEVLDLLKHVKLEADVETDDRYTEEHLTARIVNRGLSAHDAKKVAKGITSAIKSAGSLGKEVAEKGGAAAALGVAARAVGGSGLSDQEIAGFRRRFEDVLRGTGREELEPEALERDVEALFSDPKEGLDRLRHRLSLVDRDTIVALIAQRQGMDETRARGVVERVEGVLNRVRERVGAGAGGGTADTATSTRWVGGTGEQTSRAEAARAREGDAMVAHADRDRVWTEVVDQYVETYRRPSFEEDRVRREARGVFEEPSEEPEGLLARLRHLHRDDLRGIVARVPGLDERSADRMLDSLEHARDEAIHRLERLQEQAITQAEAARDFAVEQAEEARKTTATAAWWAFLSAAVSGAAAAAGGLVAVALTF